MAITLYNSLTRRKEVFRPPLDPVRMYVCGPTVYDRAHIGNARAVVVFDVLYRLLRATYGADHVRYVRNITDIDDKIIAASRESGEPIAALTERMIRLFHEDMAALDTLPPDVEPRATEHIPRMIAMIERLLCKGCAYVADGHVLFDIATCPHYGELSRKTRAELIDGARVEVAPYKRDPADFVLWKPSSEDLPGWESPWGRGRPGWHIECSAMSEAHLGESFDIHGGGVDLIFPHHENELAQSVCARDGGPFVLYWVHNGFLTVDGAKMSKSLGNFVTVGELLGKWTGGVIRLGLLGTHYREPLDWTEERPRQAQRTLGRFYRAMEIDGRGISPESTAPVPSAVLAALEDDLNTPLAIAHLHDLADAVFRSEDARERHRLIAELTAGVELMGLLSADRRMRADESFLARIGEISARVDERSVARRNRDFAKADRIRAELATEGIVLEDKSDGRTTWRWKE